MNNLVEFKGTLSAAKVAMALFTGNVGLLYGGRRDLFAYLSAASVSVCLFLGHVGLFYG